MHCKFLLRFCFVCMFFFLAVNANAQQAESKTFNSTKMKTYLIERDIPGAGALTPGDLKGISQKSCTVLKDMGPDIKWLQSYVLDNKIYCVYQAQNENLLKEHAKKGGFPITKISEISNTISPATAQ